jgi:hypothetical protein
MFNASHSRDSAIKFAISKRSHKPSNPEATETGKKFLKNIATFQD